MLVAPRKLADLPPLNLGIRHAEFHGVAAMGMTQTA
jgi:hypothetical protein